MENMNITDHTSIANTGTSMNPNLLLIYILNMIQYCRKGADPNRDGERFLEEKNWKESNESCATFLAILNKNCYEESCDLLNQAAELGYATGVKVLLNEGLNAENEDMYGWQPIHNASLHGNLEIVKILVNHGANISAQSTGLQIGNSLHYSVLSGNLELVKWLLNNKVNIDAVDGNGITPLYVAIVNNEYEIVQLLLEKGASVNARVYVDNSTPLHAAAEYGYAAIAQLLIQHGADIEAKDSVHETPLHTAAREGYLETMKLLLNEGADLTVKIGNLEDTCLHIAAIYGHEEVLLWLLNQSISVDIENNIGETALITASSYGRSNIVDILLENGANVNATQYKFDNRSGLHSASGGGHIDIVELLIKHGANLESQTGLSQTPLHWAAMGGHVNIMELLVNHGADLFTNGSDGRNCLTLAVLADHLEAVNWLIKKGFSVDVRDRILKQTLLMIAVRHKQEEIVKLLLENEADVNAVNTNSTALHIAAGLGYVDLAELLLEHGAKADMPIGFSPLHTAANTGNLGIIQLFARHGANLTAQSGDKLGTNFLEQAVISNHKDVVLWLLNNNVSVDIQNKLGGTPLIQAAYYGRLEMVEILLEWGADINATMCNADNRTALHSAVSEGHVHVVRLLLQHGADLEAQTFGTFMRPIHFAVRDGSLEIVKLLASHGVNLTSRVADKQGYSSLEIATIYDHKDILIWLLNNGVPVDIENHHGGTSLTSASLFGKLEIINVLIDKGASVNSSLQKGDNSTALHLAAYKGHTEVVRVLLKHRADKEAYNSDHLTPLLVATLESRLEVVKLLIKHGANLYAHTLYGDTCLHLASSVDLVIWLLNNNMKIDITNKKGETPLITAAEKGRVYIVKKLLESGADIHVKAYNVDNSTALHIAAWAGNKGVVRVLLEHGADPQVQSSYYKATPLHLAARKGHLGIVKLLVNSGSDVTVQDKDGRTAGQLALRYNYLEVAEFLKSDIKREIINL